MHLFYKYRYCQAQPLLSLRLHLSQLKVQQRVGVRAYTKIGFRTPPPTHPTPPPKTVPDIINAVISKLNERINPNTFPNEIYGNGHHIGTNLGT